MTDVKETSCRLCLKNITDESFEVINDIIKDILDVLLLKLKFDSESKEVICNVCRRKLNAALEFKSTCLNTDNTIIPYVDSEKMLQLDLREVYKQEKKIELVFSQKICRLCMHPVESEFRCIREEELEAIQKLTPEMNINIIKGPVVCKPCWDSLCTHNSFLKDCLEVGENVKSIFNSSATRSQIDTSPLDLFVKTENLDKEFVINEMEMSTKAESIDIKSEDEESSDTPLQTSDIVPLEESDCKNEEEDGCKHENGSEVNTKQERKVLYKCIFETGSAIRFTAHCARHEKNLRAYGCESCEYETENKKLLLKHILKHKDSLQIQMYRCNNCNLETKYKCYIKRHQMKHKDPSQVQTYRCNNCDFETKYRSHFERHQLKHKDPSQVQMYRCNDLDFETKYKHNIKLHQRKHKDPSQVQLYRCHDCDYETGYNSNFKLHQLKHEDASQVEVYGCNKCDYKTKYKSLLKQHQLKHKDPLQVQVCSCNNCDYETKNRSDIKRHQVKHKPT
ncbi:RE1-silencing transcription factor B-like [Anoplophora glabripennis]|uniref:RE1-silencing transcription factor B-like n=1 Tax=Anoplophora glabripennis TaxID=217634 RepID=UPI000C76AA94|nr:RE1-silencing transcription factor B-like [Anoplophora glabripennis]